VALALVQCPDTFISWAESERHRSLDHDLAVDARDSAKHADAASQPSHRSFDLDHISGVDRPAISDLLDAHEVDEFFAVLGLRQNHDGTDLRHGFRQDCRRQHRQLAWTMGQISFVQRDVLDADDALVGLELGYAIDEQKRIAVRKDPLDSRVVERKRDVQIASIIRETNRWITAAAVARRGVVRAWKDPE
jgi:hypothetical protein